MKKGFTLLELLVWIAIIGMLGFGVIQLFGGFRQIVTKNYGGSMTINLDPNVKLLQATWKENQLWLLTTERKDEAPQTYNFIEKSTLGILQGNVKIIEK